MPTANELQEWARLLKNVRHHLDGQGYMEVSTNCLVQAGAFEGVIDPFQVAVGGKAFELHTSPEIEMKAILAETQAPIYQICRCFRDDPETGIHLKEFTMLEFYRPWADYRELMRECTELFSSLSGGTFIPRVVPMKDLVLEHSGLDLDTLIRREDLAKALTQFPEIHISAGDSWEDLFFKFFVQRIEPTILPDEPLFIHDYPSSVAALSKTTGTGTYVERFELYWHGMEICNGCTELTGVGELQARYDTESRIRARRGKLPHPFPDRLETAMRTMPAAAGVAVGMERLFWALESKNSQKSGNQALSTTRTVT